MVYKALYELQQVFYYGSAQEELKQGLNKTGNNSFDLETRLLGEIDRFLYLAVHVSMTQKDYYCF